MRTRTFKELLYAVAHNDELDPTSSDLDAQTAAKWTSFINRFLRKGWEWDFWPEWTVTEQRAYRDSWAIGTTYQLGDEVWHEDSEKYYVSLVANNAGLDPETETASWEEATELDKYIPYQQTGLNRIAAVEGVFMRNPKKSRNPGRLDFFLSENGVQVTDLAPARPWIKFRLPSPVFTSEVWDSTVIYAAGRKVYLDATGECYVALQQGQNKSPATEASYWEKIDFPAILFDFVTIAAYANHVKSDGQKDKEIAEMDEVMDELDRVHDVEFVQQGQVEQASARVH